MSQLSDPNLCPHQEVFKSLLRLLDWSWNKLAEGILVALKQGGKRLLDFALDLERLTYIATACLRLLRSYVCEVYPSPCKLLLLLKTKMVYIL